MIKIKVHTVYLEWDRYLDWVKTAINYSTLSIKMAIPEDVVWVKSASSKLFFCNGWWFKQQKGLEKYCYTHPMQTAWKTHCIILCCHDPMVNLHVQVNPRPSLIACLSFLCKRKDNSEINSRIHLFQTEKIIWPGQALYVTYLVFHRADKSTTSHAVNKL